MQSVSIALVFSGIFFLSLGLFGIRSPAYATSAKRSIIIGTLLLIVAIFSCCHAEAAGKASLTRPGTRCRKDADCAPAICLPAENGRVRRQCSYYKFSVVVSEDAHIECFDGRGYPHRPAEEIKANVPFESSMEKNEAVCVMYDLNSAARCEVTSEFGTGPCQQQLGYDFITWRYPHPSTGRGL